MNVRFTQRNPVSIEAEHVRIRGRHLETVEAERVLVILDEALKAVRLVAAFDCIINDLEEFSLLLGRQLYSLFKKFGPIYKNYTDVCLKILAVNGELFNVCLDVETDDHKNSFNLPENFWTVPIDDLKKAEVTSLTPIPLYNEDDISVFASQITELEEERAKLKPEVQVYVRSILILFRHNPIAVQCIMDHSAAWRIKRNVALGNLIDFLEQLREILLQRLLTSPQERDEKARFLASVTRKQKQHNIVINDLKLTLQNMKTEKEKMICQMNSEIIELQRQIYELEIDGKNEIHKLRIKGERDMNEMKENHEVNKAKLTSDLTEIKNRYKDLMEKNQENELSVRRRKWKLETETEGWINKYDSDMAELQLQYDKLKLDYDNEKLALAELQKRFEPLEKEYIQVLEERRIAKEKEEAERDEHEALVYWATVIQSFWRAWKARKAMRRNRRR